MLLFLLVCSVLLASRLTNHCQGVLVIIPRLLTTAIQPFNHYEPTIPQGLGSFEWLHVAGHPRNGQPRSTFAKRCTDRTLLVHRTGVVATLPSLLFLFGIVEFQRLHRNDLICRFVPCFGDLFVTSETSFCNLQVALCKIPVASVWSTLVMWWFRHEQFSAFTSRQPTYKILQVQGPFQRRRTVPPNFALEHLRLSSP